MSILSDLPMLNKAINALMEPSQNPTEQERKELAKAFYKVIKYRELLLLFSMHLKEINELINVLEQMHQSMKHNELIHKVLGVLVNYFKTINHDNLFIPDELYRFEYSILDCLNVQLSEIYGDYK